MINSYILFKINSQAIENRIALEKKAVFDKREVEARIDTHQKEIEPVNCYLFSAYCYTVYSSVVLVIFLLFKVSLERGWGVETSNIKNVNEADDPMLQQMQIMRNYIQQAR